MTTAQNLAAQDLAAHLASASLDPEKVRALAEHIAAVEAQTGIKLRNAQGKGVPPFADIPSVEFDVAKANLGGVVDQLLGNAEVRLSVVVVGSPNIDSYEVRIFGGG